MIATGVAAGLGVAAAVPIVEGIVLSRTSRPPVPGPHAQDGTFGSGDAVPIVWLGDSLASGVGAQSADSSFPRRTALRFAELERRAVRLTCLAEPGARTVDVLTQQLPAALAGLRDGALAVVTVGSNDVGGTLPWRFRSQYTVIMKALLATGATVVAVGLPDISAARVMPQPLRALAGWVGRRADRMIRRIAAANGAHYVSIHTSPTRGTKTHEFLAADRYHPNSDTYHLWADRFVATIAAAREHAAHARHAAHGLGAPDASTA